MNKEYVNVKIEVIEWDLQADVLANSKDDGFDGDVDVIDFE